MMYKTNFIVLVLSSARHKVIIWDDHERKNRTEITFNSVIKAVKVRKDMLVIVLELKTFVFSFHTLQLIEQVETATNALGLCGIATNERAVSKVIALPNPTKGSIKVLNYGKWKRDEFVVCLADFFLRFLSGGKQHEQRDLGA